MTLFCPIVRCSFSAAKGVVVGSREPGHDHAAAGMRSAEVGGLRVGSGNALVVVPVGGRQIYEEPHRIESQDGEHEDAKRHARPVQHAGGVQRRQLLLLLAQIVVVVVMETDGFYVGRRSGLAGSTGTRRL